jgi:hypothetical protein
LHYYKNNDSIPPKYTTFTPLPMWQGGPLLLFEFFYFLKIN